MPDAPPLAALTAGGQSSRFGTDKALAQWRGKPLLAHAAQSFPPEWTRRVLIAPPGKYALSGWETRPDLRPGLGPLAGLETALHAARGGWVAFAGVDNPCLTPDYWQTLFAAVTPGVLSVQALSPERGPQPLGALYHAELLPRVTELLDAGERRLRLAAPPERVLTVPVRPEFFRNVNRVEDLEALVKEGLVREGSP